METFFIFFKLLKFIYFVFVQKQRLWKQFLFCRCNCLKMFLRERWGCTAQWNIVFLFFFLHSENFIPNVFDERFSNANVIMPKQILLRPFKITKFRKIVSFFIELVVPTLPHPLCEKRDPNKVARGERDGARVILFSRDPLAAPIVNLFPRAAVTEATDTFPRHCRLSFGPVVANIFRVKIF